MKLTNEKQRKLFKWHMLLITVFCAVIVLLFSSIYTSYKRETQQGLEDKALRDMERVELRISDMLRHTQIMTHALSVNIFDDGLSIPRDEEELYYAMERMLMMAQHSTHGIVGVAAGFEDEVFPKYKGKNGFLPLLRLDGDSIRKMQIGESINSREKSDWYVETKRAKEGRWANPMQTIDGTKLCRYCKPLYDQDSTFLGIIALDLSLDSLSREIQNFKPYESAELLVVDDEYNIIAHPNSDIILNCNFFDMLEKTGRHFHPELKEEVSRRERCSHHVMVEDSDNPENLYIFFAPIQGTKWMVHLTCNGDEVEQGMNDITSRMIALMWLTIALLVIVALTFLQQGKRG